MKNYRLYRTFGEALGFKKEISRQQKLGVHTFAGNQSGASAVEFALVAPVFLLLLFGMVAYAIYFGAAHSVQQLAADAARTAIAGMDENERKDMVSRFISTNSSSYTFIDGRKVTFTLGDSTKDVNQFALLVSYDASSLPIWNIFPGVVMPSSTITRKMEIRIGGL
jgi:Flp pilus assembly protein TadG